MSRENVQCVETESRRAVRLGVGHGVSAPELQARKSGLLVPRPSSRGLGLAFGRAVDCWIGVAQQTDRRLVRLAGRLSSAQVPELLEACADALPIELDLSDLVSADAVGIDALQRLRSLGHARRCFWIPPAEARLACAKAGCRAATEGRTKGD
jgi:hypothetical protein